MTRLLCLATLVPLLGFVAPLGAAAVAPVACPLLEGPPPRELPAAYTIPTIDLAGETQRQVVVDREKGQYLGHPTTVLLEDNRTMIAVYPKGHGGGAIVMKRSADAGLTWSDRLPVPANWATSQEVPTLYPTVGPDGHRRLIMFSGLYPIKMARSEDDGRTWTPLEPIGDFGGIVAMADCVRLAGGSYMALFHDDGRFIKGGSGKHRASPAGRRSGTWTVYKTLSADGGLTWSDATPIAKWTGGPNICEPGAVRSPDGKELCVLLRENSRKFNSLVMFSRDEGKTWTPPRQVPAALTGDRHQALYAPDGRLVISFRDTTRQSPTKGDWVLWVGTYDDIKQGREGQYRVRLMDNHKGADCAYPALERLPDGTFVATTYGHWTEGEAPYIASVRFKVEEIDARAKAAAATLKPETTVVYGAGKDGYHTYRIPAMLATTRGTLLAFCEGRKTSRGDHGDIDLVLKRSTDGGCTWSKQMIVHEEGGTEKITIGNPAPVLDRSTGTVHLAFCRNNARVFVTSSADDGVTWARPREITDAVKADDWGWYATGPGHGIQLARGPHAGRLVIPCDHGVTGKDKGWKTKGRSHVIYSDDNGRTWRRGGPTGWGMNECMAVEQADGSVLLSIRNYFGKNQRAFAVSRDGGYTWSDPTHHEQVHCPTCQASICRYSLEPANRILHANPGGPGRTHLTVRLSEDEGRSWPTARVLHAGPAAYSDLAVLPDGSIGCLYEAGKKGAYDTITFARFPLAWVTGE